MRRAVTAIGLTLIACGGAPQVDTAAEAERIRVLDQRWLDALAARDFDAMMVMYAADAREMLANQPAIEGHDSILAFFQALHARFPRFSHHFEPRTITVAQSGDLAVVTGTYRFIPDSLDPQNDDVGKFVGVWKRQDGQWRLALDISNSDRPIPLPVP